MTGAANAMFAALGSCENEPKAGNSGSVRRVVG